MYTNERRIFILTLNFALHHPPQSYFCQRAVQILLKFVSICADLGSGGESVKKLETKVFVGNTVINTAKTELITVSFK